MKWSLKRTSALMVLSLVTPAMAQQTGASMQPPAVSDTMTPVGLGYGTAVPPVAPDTIDDPNFNAALAAQMPLTPAQIDQAKRLRSQVNQALATPGGGAPVPQISSIDVRLDPGSPAPVIHLAQGNMTTLIFEDKTGAPWPVTGAFTAAGAGITAQIVGNSLMADAPSQASSSSVGQPQSASDGQVGQAADASANVAALAKDSSNIVTLFPDNADIIGKNLVVTLQGYNLPIIFTFEAGSDIVDYRTDVMVPGDGPNAVISEPKPDMPSVDMDGIQAFVDGVPPSGAVKMDVSDPSISVWYYKGKMFVRTSDTMASASDYSRSSVTGDSVYVLDPGPIFDVFFNGAIEQVQVSNLPPAYDYHSQSTSFGGAQ